MRRWLLFVFVVAISGNLTSFAAEKPRLVVVVSIDQFAAEYLDRFRAGFQPNGLFLKLCDEGANFTNCHHGHAFTKTGPGHSVLMTGTFPSSTGIVENNWFDRDEPDSRKQDVYCVEDAGVQIVGSAEGKTGKSPKNLFVSTVGDVLKTNVPQARVFGIGLKDRAAILMAGHRPDGAYWLEGGTWVTSTYYRKDLPTYLRIFNESGGNTTYSERTWNLLHPLDRYTIYYPDDAEFEGALPASPQGSSSRAFPHKMPSASDKKAYDTAMTTSPFGNDLTLAVARLIVNGEQLGKRGVPDILCINLSSNDYVGHMFGPHSLEVQDISFRTDLQLGDFARFLNQHLVDQPWVMFVTADHGVAPIPAYARQQGLPAQAHAKTEFGPLSAHIEAALREQLASPSGGSYVELVDDQNVYLNRNLPQLRGEAYQLAQNIVREQLLREPFIAAAFTRTELSEQTATAGLAQQFQRAFNPKRSGDVLYAWAPYHMIGGKAGTTHGSPWTYDTHVPLLVYGRGIKAGRHAERVTPASIAPTISRMLGIPLPPACAVEALNLQP